MSAVADRPRVAPAVALPGGAGEALPGGAGEALPGGAAKAAVLALPDAVAFEVAAACQILGTELPGVGAPYQVQVCGERPGPVATGSGFALRVDVGLAALAGADLVIV